MNLVGPRMIRKTETLNLRVSPEFKELVRVAAEHESRSISNLLEVLVRDYCRQKGVDPTTETEPTEAKRKTGA
jgi:hypothetical protein